jgi:hypothetical protein
MPGDIRRPEYIPGKARAIAGRQSAFRSCSLGGYSIECQRDELPTFSLICPQVQLLCKFRRIGVVSAASFPGESEPFKAQEAKSK